MTELSPAAQAVWNAYQKAECDPYLVDPRRVELAAALRAAAGQVVLKLAGLGQESAWYLEEIAAELEGAQ